jgi:integrase
MAAIRKVRKHGRTRWRVSWYDALRTRRQRFFCTRAEAEAQQAEAILQGRQKLTARVERRITMRDYVAQWLPRYAAEHQLKARTRQSYDGVLRTHVVPALGDLRVSTITQPAVKALLARQRERGAARNSVCLLHSVLALVCASAVEDGLLVVNPTLGLRKKMRLGASTEALAEAVQAKAMAQAELDHALTVARTSSPLFRLYVLLARTGLRISEALAIQDGDLDLEARRLRVVRQLGAHGATTAPKGGHGRSVDLSVDAVTVLKAEIAEKKRRKLAGAFATLPPWTFCTATGVPYRSRNVLRDWHQVQVRAGLVDATGHPRFGLHAFRHTFASLCLLHDPEKLLYIQEQLGHLDVRLTRTIYGSAFKRHDPAAADQQDARSTPVVTTPVTEADSGT